MTTIDTGPAMGRPFTDTPHSGLEAARARRIELVEAMGRLETAIARPTGSEGWIEDVDGCMMDLRSALDAHIGDVEAPDGLLAEIMAEEPRLASSIQEIKDEHIELLRGWEAAHKRLRDSSAPDRKAVRRGATGLLGRLAVHRQRGSDLVYDAYNVDISAAD